MIFSTVYELKKEAELKSYFHKLSCENYKKHLENSDNKIFVISTGGLGCDIEGTKREYSKKYNIDVIVDCQGCLIWNSDRCKEKVIEDYLKKTMDNTM
ncbi:hypothetical protein GCM10022393_26920 [Aquimarina addita]|uniref:Uncharacterized protein n=1 Tax=Aquimarina addita TaxID=870485 RepID=A0ABP6ULQ1_9FLAO